MPDFLLVAFLLIVFIGLAITGGTDYPKPQCQYDKVLHVLVCPLPEKGR